MPLSTIVFNAVFHLKEIFNHPKFNAENRRMYLVFKSPLRKFSFEAVALFSFPPALIYLYLFALCLLHHPAYACYVYPPDMKDPCEQKQCSYGAQCVPSLDGFSHRCQCPTRCNTYGDNIGSTPVCGNDGIDYDNMCEMRKAACQQMTDIRVKYYGKCGKYTFNLPFRLSSLLL